MSLSSSHRTLPRSAPLGVHLAAAAPAWAQGPDLGVSVQAPIGLGCVAVVLCLRCLGCNTETG